MSFYTFRSISLGYILKIKEDVHVILTVIWNCLHSDYTSLHPPSHVWEQLFPIASSTCYFFFNCYQTNRWNIVSRYSFILFCLIFVGLLLAVPQGTQVPTSPDQGSNPSGIQLVPPAVEARNPIHWTVRESLVSHYSFNLHFLYNERMSIFLNIWVTCIYFSINCWHLLPSFLLCFCPFLLIYRNIYRI